MVHIYGCKSQEFIDKCVVFITHKEGDGKFEGFRFMLKNITLSLQLHKDHTIFLQRKVVLKELENDENPRRLSAEKI